MLERDGAVRVDLDQADFGYCVGEIEVLMPEGGDMNAALQRITSTAAELGELMCCLWTLPYTEGICCIYIYRI